MIEWPSKTLKALFMDKVVNRGGVPPVFSLVVEKSRNLLKFSGLVDW